MGKGTAGTAGTARFKGTAGTARIKGTAGTARIKGKAMDVVRIRLRHRGALGAHGYSAIKDKTVAQRQAALTRASGVMGWATIVRRLNVLYIYNKKRRPRIAALFRQDREYASEQLRRQLR